MMYMDMALSALSGNDTLGNLAIPPSEITNGTTTGGDGVTTPAGDSAGTYQAVAPEQTTLQASLILPLVTLRSITT